MTRPRDRRPPKVGEAVAKSDTGVCLIEGGLHVDTRGTVGFVNGFDFRGVDRAYWVRAHRPNYPRGWVGHRREQKWFWVLEGTLLLAVVKPNTWRKPAKELPVLRFVLSAVKPQVLHVPPGYCTASMDLGGDAILLICASGRIQGGRTDDLRYPPDYWKILG